MNKSLLKDTYYIHRHKFDEKAHSHLVSHFSQLFFTKKQSLTLLLHHYHSDKRSKNQPYQMFYVK